jgi:plastocyanin domain-containing protein
MTLAILSSLLLLAAADAKAEKARTVEMSVTEKGFEPEKITVKKGEPVHLVVTRKTERTCATEIAIKDLGIRKELPLDKPVPIDFTPQKTGEIKYVCGMDMIGGVLLVQ